LVLSRKESSYVDRTRKLYRCRFFFMSATSELKTDLNRRRMAERNRAKEEAIEEDEGVSGARD
jgi:hypothetical protein